MGSKTLPTGSELSADLLPLASRQELSSSSQDFSPSEFISKILGSSSKNKLDQETRDELAAISRSKSPKRFFREILDVGRSLADEGEGQVAALLFSETVRQLEQDFSPRPLNYRKLISEANAGLEGLQGGGPWPVQLKNFLSTARREMVNPIGFTSFFAATTTFLPLRYHLLGKMLPAGRLYTAGQKLRAHLLATSIATPAEIAAYVGTGRGLRNLASKPHPMSLEQEIYGAGAMLGLSKFTGWTGKELARGLQKSPMGKISPLGYHATRLGQWTLPHGINLAGVMTVLKKEEDWGWREEKDFSGLFLESLGTVAHMWMVGKGLEILAGRRYQDWTKKYHLGMDELLHRGGPSGQTPSGAERVLAYLRAKGLVPQGMDRDLSSHWNQKRYPHIFRAQSNDGAGNAEGPRPMGHSINPENKLPTVDLTQGVLPWDSKTRGTQGITTYVHAPKPENPRGKPEELTVATYNVGFFAGKKNLGGKGAEPLTPAELQANQEQAIKALNQIQPDLLLFQELDFGSARTFRNNQMDALARGLGMYYGAHVITWDVGYLPFPFSLNPKHHMGRVLSGQAVLSKYPIVAQETFTFAKPPNPFWYNWFYLDRIAQKIRIDLGGSQFALWNTHLEAFHPQVRLKQADLLADWVNREGHLPKLVGGDFNSGQVHGFLSTENHIAELLVVAGKKIQQSLGPERPLTDLQKAQIKNTIEETSLHFLNQTGLKEAAPFSPTFQSWDGFAGFDHLAYQPTHFHPKMREVLQGLESSDHVPVWAKFSLKK